VLLKCLSALLRWHSSDKVCAVLYGDSTAEPAQQTAWLKPQRAANPNQRWHFKTRAHQAPNVVDDWFVFLELLCAP